MQQQKPHVRPRVTEVPITPSLTRRASRTFCQTVRGLHIIEEEPARQCAAGPRTVHDQIREHIGEGVQ